MAKKKKSRSHRAATSIVVRKVQGTGEPAESKYIQRRGPSPALKRATGAVSVAQKAASKARAVAAAEPTRAVAGVVVGNVLGKVAGDMIHEAGIKKPSGTLANNEASANLAVGAVGGVVAIAGAMMKGSGVARRFAIHIGSNLASHSLGAANAISRQNKTPLNAVKATQGSEDIDPFDTGDASEGAKRRQRIQTRRSAIVKRVSARLAAEDPTAATEGGLEEYVAGLFDDLSDMLELDETLETGMIVPIAAALAPEAIRAASNLISLIQAGQEAKAKEAAAKGQTPVTAAVLELEGEESETGAPARAKARQVRIQRKSQTPAQRKQTRKVKRQTLAEKRRQRLEQRRADRPIVIQLEQPARETLEPEYMDPGSEEQPIILIPSDAEVQDVAEGRPLRRYAGAYV